MLKTIRQTIRQYNMLTPGDGVVVGLSGGADSVALLSALLALGGELQFSVYAAHINHNLRDAAKRDEDFVRHLCEGWGVPFIVYQADVKGYVASQKLSIEEAGRNLRYQYLRQSLSHFNAQKIAVGHHADDNAETVLINLFRGAGLKGLCGIPPVNGNIIRPLLEVSRKCIEIYAAENNLKFVTDETNAASDHTRNYIRNEIIPIIRRHFGDSVTETMARNALLIEEDEAHLHAKTKAQLGLLFDDSCPSGEISEITLPIEKLQALPKAIATRIIRETISRLRGKQALEDIQSVHIHAILDITQGHTGREVDLPGFRARREYENLILYIPSMGLSSGFCYPLSIDIPVYIPPLSVTFSLHPPKKQEKHHNCCTQAFNYDKFNNVLELRTRRPGDKITLAYGTKKLQDYFTDTKTPRSRRDKIPLLADGSNILWIMDMHNPINTAYRPVEGSRTCWVTCEYNHPCPT